MQLGEVVIGGGEREREREGEDLGLQEEGGKLASIGKGNAASSTLFKSVQMSISLSFLFFCSPYIYIKLLCTKHQPFLFAYTHIISTHFLVYSVCQGTVGQSVTFSQFTIHYPT